MRLVVDSNRIISALIKKGLTLKIISSINFEFYTLDHVIEEVKKYREYVKEKTKMDEKELELLFSLIMENICIVPDKDVKSHVKEAMDTMKNIDIKDSPILACALAIPNEGIWTEDKHLEKQSKIKVWKTKELVKYV